MNIKFFDAKPYFDTEPIRDLMWLALPYPNDEMLDRLLQRYHDDDDMRLIAAMDDADNIQGLIGLKIDGVGEAMILHLRVQDDAQRQGVGAALVKRVISYLKLSQAERSRPRKPPPVLQHNGFLQLDRRRKAPRNQVVRRPLGEGRVRGGG